MNRTKETKYEGQKQGWFQPLYKAQPIQSMSGQKLGQSPYD
jgi:hypothetical protein